MDWKPVQKKPITVKARGPIDDNETHTVHAGDLNASQGDFVIDDGNATYPIDANILYKTYNVPSNPEKIDGWFKVTKKPVEVEARGPLQSAETVSTLEGKVRAKAGDYIIKGVEGEKHPIRPDEFDRLYKYL